MAIKSILCIFGGSGSEVNAVNTSLLLGKDYGAVIRFLHISPDPNTSMGIYGESIVVTASMMDAVLQENKQRLQQATKHVHEIAAKHHVPLDAPESPAHRVSAHFVHVTGHMESIVAREGRLSDLIIVSRGVSDMNALYDPTLLAAIFRTGRPIMLLPVNKAHQEHPKTVVTAWKSSREAARAMYQAMPLLEKAEKVYLLSAEGFGENADLGMEATLEYLRSHGVHAQGVVLPANMKSPGEMLLDKSKELEADLLVMGAYGHSRMREMMLGGMTNFMLEKADIPLLLSH